MMNGAMPGADGECFENGLADKSFRQYRSPFHVDSGREISCHSGGERTTGAMCVTRADARSVEFAERLSVVKKVNGRSAPMPSFDDNASSAHGQDSPCSLAQIRRGR